MRRMIRERKRERDKEGRMKKKIRYENKDI